MDSQWGMALEEGPTNFSKVHRNLETADFSGLNSSKHTWSSEHPQWQHRVQHATGLCLESSLVNRWFRIRYSFSQGNSLINAVRFPDWWDWSLGKRGVLLSVFKGSKKSYCLCTPGQRASAGQNFEIRQLSVTSSLQLWQLFPGEQVSSGPSLGHPCYLCGWLHTHPPLLSHPVQTYILRQQELLGKRLSPEWRWQPSCRCWHFQPLASVRAVFFLIRWPLPPKGGLALPGAVPIKFLSISHRYFPSTFKLCIINLWFMNSLKLKKKKWVICIFMFF